MLFQEEATDGWDDFDIDNPIEEEKPLEKSKDINPKPIKKESTTKENIKSKDTGWDDFDDWGQDDFNSNTKKASVKMLNVKRSKSNFDSLS